MGPTWRSRRRILLTSAFSIWLLISIRIHYRTLQQRLLTPLLNCSLNVSNLSTNTTVDRTEPTELQLMQLFDDNQEHSLIRWFLRLCGVNRKTEPPEMTAGECQATYSVALIVPFRDRHSHLNIFLRHYHRLLRKQLLHYAVFIVEQAGNDSTFNRGKLMNIGYREARKLRKWHCYIFHDIDMLLENERQIYRCDRQSPRHFSVAIQKWNYGVPYGAFFGGVSALTGDQMESVNGFSNSFWGWGGEDDEMNDRIRLKHMRVVRPPRSLGRYATLSHRRDRLNAVNNCRLKLMSAVGRRWHRDGLNSTEYTLLQLTRHPLYYNISVDLHFPQSQQRLQEEGVCSNNRRKKETTENRTTVGGTKRNKKLSLRT